MQWQRLAELELEGSAVHIVGQPVLVREPEPWLQLDLDRGPGSWTAGVVHEERTDIPMPEYLS